jgi:hypothetical protein
MRLFTSLTNRIWLADHADVPALSSNETKETIRAIWNGVFHSKSSQQAYSTIMSFNNTLPYDEEYFIQRTEKSRNMTKYVVVVSGRTAWWLDNKEPLQYYTLFPHTYNATVASILQLADPQYFDLMYKIDQKMYVFELGRRANVSTNDLMRTDYLFEDPQIKFWAMEFYGKGGYSAVLSQIDCTIDSTMPNNSLNITTITGDSRIWVLLHEFAGFADLEDYDVLLLPFYGQSTNRTFYLSLDGPTIYDRTIFLFKDDFIGWNHVMLAMHTPTATENGPDLGRVIRITFNPFNEDAHMLGELCIGPIMLIKILS